MRSQYDIAHIALIWLAVHKSLHGAFQSRNVFLVQRPAPDIEKIPQPKFAPVRRFDVDDAGGVMRVQPIESFAAGHEILFHLVRLNDADTARDGDSPAVIEQ